MRISLGLAGLTLLLLAGCGARTDPGSSPQGRDSTPGTDTSTSGDGSVPRIDPAAAPNVAFGYRYSFGLAADQIAPVQQGHARACEELGRERCQVVGMDYRRRDDRVEAELSLAVDPSVAHRFGEQALASVREAEGTLVNSEVTGTPVRPAARDGAAAIEDLERELAELQQRVGQTRDPALQGSLNAQAAALRERIRALRSDQGAVREQLATTNVSLAYSSSPFATGSPDFGGALGGAWGQLKWIAYWLFSLLMLVGPWALAAGLIWLAARRLRRGKAVHEGA